MREILNFKIKFPNFALPNKRRCIFMLIINVKENESIDKALKRFKKKFEKTGVLRQLRKRQAFEKPSVARRNEVIHAAYVGKLRSNEEM
jgi:small subunit ribosomal protein S21